MAVDRGDYIEITDWETVFARFPKLEQKELCPIKPIEEILRECRERRLREESLNNDNNNVNSNEIENNIETASKSTTKPPGIYYKKLIDYLIQIAMVINFIMIIKK